jgi:hypothetical protein
MNSMDPIRLDALIALLTDRSARIDERDDAAIDLGSSDDPRAIAALLEIGADRSEIDTVLASCGESLAQIAIRSGRLSRVWIASLAPAAANELVSTIRAERAELLDR